MLRSSFLTELRASDLSVPWLVLVLPPMPGLSRILWPAVAGRGGIVSELRRWIRDKRAERSYDPEVGKCLTLRCVASQLNQHTALLRHLQGPKGPLYHLCCRLQHTSPV